MRLYELCLKAILTLAPLLPKSREAVRGRDGLLDRLKENSHCFRGRVLWFHASSAGELEQCFPILDELKAAQNPPRIFLSFFSPSGASAIEREKQKRKRCPLPWDYSDYAPLDLREDLEAAFSIIQPSDLILIHRELWPQLISVATERGVKTHLIAGFWKRPVLLKNRLKKLSSIGTVDRESLERLKGVVSDLWVGGDPRVDRLLSRVKEKKPSKEPPLFVGASLWPKDFEALLPSLFFLFSQTWKIALVPHEPTEPFLRQIERTLRRKNIESARMSQKKEAPFLIVDSVGSLIDLYEEASLVFVGGSFQRRVHNVLEPAAAQKPILVGPFYRNSPDATRMVREGIGAKSARSAEELLALTRHWGCEESVRLKASAYLQNYIEARRGAAERYAAFLIKGAMPQSGGRRST